jgi:DNA polymerase-1
MSAASTMLSSSDCAVMLDALPYRTIVVADFEFEFGGHSSFDDASRSGERPRPVCMVAKDLRTGETWKVWRDELGARPPFPIGADALFVAFYASAELGCFRALSWPRPANILDLFTEFRDRTNGLTTPAGAGLIGALTYFGLDGIGSQEKDELRARVLRGGPWAAEERAAILDYCESDIVALERLLPAMLPCIDLPRALLRGRYMAAAAAMEWNGVPIDVATLGLLRQRWTDIQDDLIRSIDADYGVFEGRSFRAQRWAEYLVAQGIPWPRLESDRLDLSDDAFREMARIHPKVAPMRELRSALSELRLKDLAVGHDGRNRTILSAFRSRTGRNQPSNTKFIFGPSVWLRGLIQPPPGHGVAYVDWSQQEFGVAAALSGDAAMCAAYQSGDPYLTFAKQAGAVPPDATKDTHKIERELFKTCALGVQYGMEAESLARRISQQPIVARDLLRAHRETYRTFWRWSDAAVDHAMLRGSLHTVFGWHVHAGENVNPRSLRNFPMQANGAEMLRMACCLATERGIEVCAPVHDAVLICAPLERLEADVARMRTCMAEASRIILAGFELRTDATLIRYLDRYSDPRGAVMWNRVMHLVTAQQAERAAA